MIIAGKIALITGGAHRVGNAVEADHRHVVAFQEFHQIITLQHRAGFGELGAGVGGVKLGLEFRKKTEISEDGGNFGHGGDPRLEYY